MFSEGKISSCGKDSLDLFLNELLVSPFLFHDSSKLSIIQTTELCRRNLLATRIRAQCSRFEFSHTGLVSCFDTFTICFKFAEFCHILYHLFVHSQPFCMFLLNTRSSQDKKIAFQRAR